MALDTYQQLWNRVKGVCPAADPLLCQRWVVDAFRRIAERRRWSWLVKYGQFIVPQIYNTGTVSITQGQTAVTGVGTTFTPAMVGRQFRIGNSTPIYTIASYVSATQINLDNPWGATTQSGVAYSIYQCYFTPPNDFFSFISIYDPLNNWQLVLNISQEELNSWDAQRANTGQAYLAANFDYTQSTVGSFSGPTQIVGTGAAPVLGGNATYTGAANAIFTIVITTGGNAGTAIYEWQKNSAGYTTNVATNNTGAPQSLQDGVTVVFPTGVSFTSGDTFIIQAFVVNSPGLPRYELWPHNQANYCYPFLYEARATDLNDPGAVLPRYIRGDLVMDMALTSAASWPGPSVDAPNPYYDLNLYDRLLKKCEYELGQLERQDEEVYQQMVSYATNLTFNPWFDAAFLQSHAF